MPKNRILKKWLKVEEKRQSDWEIDLIIREYNIKCIDAFVSQKLIEIEKREKTLEEKYGHLSTGFIFKEKCDKSVETDFDNNLNIIGLQAAQVMGLDKYQYNV